MPELLMHAKNKPLQLASGCLGTLESPDEVLQVERRLGLADNFRSLWVSSWPVSLGGTSRNIAIKTLSQMIATRDLWMQSGTGVSRKPSESVFFGLVLRRAGGASASHGPPKVCDDLRGSCAAVEGVRKTLCKNRFIFRDFSDVFKFFKFSGP